jgi:hypothetical protein
MTSRVRGAARVLTPDAMATALGAIQASFVPTSFGPHRLALLVRLHAVSAVSASFWNLRAIFCVKPLLGIIPPIISPSITMILGSLFQSACHSSDRNYWLENNRAV